MPGDVDASCLSAQTERLAIGAPRRAARQLEVAGDHFLDQFGERRDLGLPAELVARLGGIAEQQVDLGRPEVARVDPDHGLAGLGVDARSRRRPGRAIRCVRPTSANASSTNSRTERARRWRSRNRRARPAAASATALDIVAGVAPVALGVEVAEIERLFQARLDARRRRA